MKTQNEIVLRELRYRKIDARYMFVRFGIMRLAARIRDLRQQGHDIDTINCKNSASGNRWAEYRLVKPKGK